MKQFLKSLLLLALILALASPVSAAGKVKKNRDGTVDIDMWYGASVSEAGPPPVDWLAYKIIREKLGINLKLTPLPSSESDSDVKINAAAASNRLPDMVQVGSKVYQNLVKQGLVAQVDDMYPLMPNRCKVIYNQAAIDFTKINGKSYALAQTGTLVCNEGMVIRKDWLDKLGLAVPKTTEEFFAVMKAFTTKDPDGNGKNDTYGFGAYVDSDARNEGLGRRFDPIFGAFGVPGTWNLTAAGAGLNVLKPEYYDALCFVKRMIDEKVIDPNWLAYKKDDFRAAWKQGKFGMFREQNAALHAESNYAPFDKNFPDGELVVIAPPVGPSGKSSVGTAAPSYRLYVVSKNAEKKGKKEYIAKLLEWMSSDEGYYLLGYGVAGVNYVMGADGVPTVNGIPDASKGYSKSEMQPLTQLRNMVFYNGDAELASRYPTYVTAVSHKTMSALKTLRIMQSYPWTMVTGVEQLPQPDADLERFYNQGVMEFMTGLQQLTKENWNAWIEKFKAQGGQKWNDDGVAFAKANNLIH